MIDPDPIVLDKYQLVIGLEVHIQLLTHSKAYSSDRNEYGSSPNSNISPVTLGHPGTLPVLNRKTVEFAIRLGLACHADIAREQHFARKNYFYPDLPKGYQITQDTTPICTGGYIEVRNQSGEKKKITLTRIHMEEDAGKSLHDIDPFNTLIDLNRAGVPLLEIVSEPDITSSTEAAEYLMEVRKLVRYLDICDGNLEEGSMRCDANISVMLKGSEKFGTRVEVKNMNSMRNVQRAIEYEFRRQVSSVEAGELIIRDTRNFNATDGTTTSMRLKEESMDYRYFPEPDLQPLLVSQQQIDRVKSAMPALPNELFEKYTKQYKLSDYDAGNLVSQKEIALYFESVIKCTSNYKAAANWMMGEVKSWLNEGAEEIEEFPVSPEQLAGLINLIDSGQVTHNLATQKIFPQLLMSEKSAVEIAKENEWIVQTDDSALRKWVVEVFSENPEEYKRLQAGESKLTGFLMGKLMKKSGGKADPKIASKLINEMAAQ